MQVVINDLLINYEVLGANTKSTILILHGWKRSIDDWKYIASKLADKHKIILVDLPGMGSSSLPQVPFGTYNYASFIKDLINKFELKDITIIGHSFGGKVAAITACTEKNISKLILVDASGINQKSFLINLKLFISKLIKPLKILPKQFLVSDDYKTAGNLLPIFKKVVSEHIEKDLEKIKIKTLIIWGDKDSQVNISHAKKFKELIPNSILRIVWGTGHDPFLEKPDKFLEILTEYV